ncbi:MAG: hypothetical protein IKF82_01215 [Bacilli bacterium]|nr:hypothetical protein [Bacilli bacterium]
MSYRPTIKTNSAGATSDFPLDAETIKGHAVEETGIASDTNTIPTTAQVKAYVDTHSGGGSGGNYLPLTGGTLSNATWGEALKIQRTGGDNASVITYMNSSSGVLGRIGFKHESNVYIPYLTRGSNGTDEPIITDAGANPNLNNGDIITQPGGASAFSLKTLSSSKDTGILRISDDNAYICNSSDDGYSFAVFDTDLTTNFNSDSTASFVVLSNGRGLKTRGNYVLAPVLLWSGSASSATVSGDYTHYIVTVNYGMKSFGSIIVKKRTSVRSAMVTAYSSAEVDFFAVEVSTTSSGSNETITASGFSNYIFSTSFSNDTREMTIKEIYGIKME